MKWISLNSCQLFNWSTQLNNTNLDQPITKRWLIWFSLWCEKVALAIKEEYLSKTWSGRVSEESLGIKCHSLPLNELVSCPHKYKYINNYSWCLNNSGLTVTLYIYKNHAEMWVTNIIHHAFEKRLFGHLSIVLIRHCIICFAPTIKTTKPLPIRKMKYHFGKK